MAQPPRRTAPPFVPFPVAPAEYSQRYMAEITRVFALFQQQVQNPGLGQFSTLTVTLLPTYANNAAALAGGLASDMVYKTSTGELRIVV